MTFANDRQPVRSVVLFVRVTPEEARLVDRLAKTEPGGRSGVLRAGLNALLRERATQGSGASSGAGA